MGKFDKAVELAKEFGKTIGLMVGNALEVYGEIKEGTALIRRVDKIYENGVNFENPEQEDLNAAKSVAEAVMIYAGSSSDKSYNGGSIILFSDICSAKLSGGGVEIEALDAFTSFAQGCRKLCDDHDIDYGSKNGQGNSGDKVMAQDIGHTIA